MQKLTKKHVVSVESCDVVAHAILLERQCHLVKVVYFDLQTNIRIVLCQLNLFSMQFGIKFLLFKSIVGEWKQELCINFFVLKIF